jgi:hypothetical protein
MATLLLATASSIRHVVNCNHAVQCYACWVRNEVPVMNQDVYILARQTHHTLSDSYL